jgi:hypothetical protein
MASRPLCTDDNCDAHYACRLRAKGLQVSPRAQSTKTLNWKPTPSVPPSINKTIIYDERPGGYKMPVLKPDGDVLRWKEYTEKRHKVESHLRHAHSAVHTKE